MSAEQELEKLIHEYGKLVFHTIYGLTGDWEESQDLTQDTFQQALKALDAARATSGANFHAKAWLLRIALNTARMQQRRKKLFRFIPFSHIREEHEQDNDAEEAVSNQALSVQPAGYGANAQDDPAERIAERDAVQRTLAKLPETMRVCLLLSIVGGLSTSEIASTLALNEPAVRQRLGRARKQFQQIYTYENGEQLVDKPTTTHVTQTQQRSEPRESQTPAQKPQRLQLTKPIPNTGSSYG
ncbi:MAG TPA: RNA polymerase sigma factor [Ktedonobacteraceae bacterium]|jgi:RNA polymerase sigma-70 factor (ECF subfamily)|nr:RNA polymerase sigma factor [Ktedonobacteraceae bacterium]